MTDLMGDDTLFSHPQGAFSPIYQGSQNTDNPLIDQCEKIPVRFGHAIMVSVSPHISAPYPLKEKPVLTFVAIVFLTAVSWDFIARKIDKRGTR